MRLFVAIFGLFLRINSLSSVENTHEKKILICGVCKNVEKGFNVVYESVYRLVKNFSDYRVIVYENNSTDCTKQLYQKWALHDKKIIFLSEDLGKKELEGCTPLLNDCRIEYISRARNIVLDEINKNDYKDFDYVLMADLDEFFPWDIENIIQTIEKPEQDWDAVFANGLYDILALRTDEC